MKVYYNYNKKMEIITSERKLQMRIRYDEIKPNDIILFYGANVRIVELHESPAPANKWYPNEKTITFTVEPADDEALEILGRFYGYGTYGGVGCLETELVSREEA